MAYFRYTGPFADFRYEDEWKEALHQIHSAEPHIGYPLLQKVSHPIEVKALHIFTFASRFLHKVDLLKRTYKYSIPSPIKWRIDQIVEREWH